MGVRTTVGPGDAHEGGRLAMERRVWGGGPSRAYRSAHALLAQPRQEPKDCLVYIVAGAVNLDEEDLAPRHLPPLKKKLDGLPEAGASKVCTGSSPGEGLVQVQHLPAKPKPSSVSLF